MNWYLLVRFIHIFGSIVFIGGILARQAVRMQGKKSTAIHTLAVYFLAAGKIESLMVIPGNMLVIIFGVILAIMVRAPILGFLQGSEQNWLLATNILLILSGLNVPLIFLPRGKIFDRLMDEALAKGAVTPELKAHLDDRTVKVAHIFEIVSLIIIVILMVFKPF